MTRGTLHVSKALITCDEPHGRCKAGLTPAGCQGEAARARASVKKPQGYTWRLWHDPRPRTAPVIQTGPIHRRGEYKPQGYTWTLWHQHKVAA